MSKIPKSSNKSIHDALRVLARDIQSEDGAANVAIAEAADRISELGIENDRLHDENAALREALASAEVGLKHALMMEPGDPFKRIKAITAALDAVRAAKKEAQP